MSLNKKLRVLIADDAQEARHNIGVMISALDNLEVVAVASNGRQAIEMAMKHHPNIAIIDINMPIMDGLTAAEQILKNSSNVGCIIISGERDPETIRDALSIGIQEYLIKPFTVDELEASIRRVSDQLGNAGKVQGAQKIHVNETQLKQLAEEYIKSRRTDDQAIGIFEQLIDLPDCEARFVQTLAIIYVLRAKWGKLKSLAEKIEQRTNEA
jgi:YesN/AraC family two-component response regulator